MDTESRRSGARLLSDAYRKVSASSAAVSANVKVVVIYVMTTNEKGNIALTQAIAYFAKKQYTVSVPLNDSQWYDLVIEKDGIFQSVQVKYTGEKSKSGSYKCSLRTISGTSRKPIYTLKDHSIDLLFCYCEDGSKFLIPCKEIENKNNIALYTEKSKFVSKNLLDTSKFLIID